MTILIDNKSGQPIYEQIVDQIREQILTGALGPDEALPSIRSLAKDLRISVITTKRAYEELEQEGFLYTVAGKGCFVAEKNTELLREEDLRRIEEHLSEIRRLAARCGLTRAELEALLDPAAFTGMAGRQCECFLKEEVRPLLAANRELLNVSAKVEV